MHRSLAKLLVLAALLSAGGAARSAAVVRIVDNNGALLQLSIGKYADLFSVGTAQSASTYVLAVDVARDGQPASRLLVPGSEGIARDAVPYLLSSPADSAFFVVWTATQSNGDSRVLVNWYGAQGWSDPVELITVSGAAPQVVLTRDSFVSHPTADTTVQHSRIVLHFFWWVAENNDWVVRYTPAIFIDGHFVGVLPVLDLTVLDPLPPLGQGFFTVEQLRASLSVTANGESPRFAVSFARQATGRLLTYEIQLLPKELGDLADKARGHIIDLAASLGPNRNALGGAMAQWLLDQGRTLHPADSLFVAEGTASMLQSSDPAERVESIAERARGHIIDLVAAPVRGGVRDEDPAQSESLILIPEQSSVASGTTYHVLRARLMGDRIAPLWLTPATPFQLLTSPHAGRVVIASVGTDRVTFAESSDTFNWSDKRSLSLSALSQQEALDLLKAHLVSGQ